jgi:glycosyltransferase involved in cell wall biosynthesis
MPDRYRVLLISTHPVQYASPLFRRMAQHPQLNIQVAYCSLQGAEAAVDVEFGVEVKWDVPLLEGYPWVHVPNKSPRPGLGRFFGLINPGLWKLVSKGGWDAVVIFTGYACASFWIALVAAKLHRQAILFGADAHELNSRDGKRWKAAVKRFLWPRVFSLATVVIVPSSGGAGLMRSLGIGEERVVVTPYVVDNDWWIAEAERVDRAAVRRAWGVPEDAQVVLFCAKLQPWKRPADLLLAFAKAGVTNAHLVYAGDGPLRRELERQARSLGLDQRVHFLGFVNQSQLPAVYRASDLLALPSELEPFGVVVNEAMLCGCAAVVSDRVGAGRDLIAQGENGYVFPCADTERLASILRDLLQDATALRRMGEAARSRMSTWSPRENIEALVVAIERATAETRRMKPGVVRLSDAS